MDFFKSFLDYPTTVDPGSIASGRVLDEALWALDCLTPCLWLPVQRTGGIPYFDLVRNVRTSNQNVL